MTAAELLAASVAAHSEYRAAHDRTPQDVAGMRDALQRAADARTAAQALDPKHADPVWADLQPTHPHEALTTFYREQLA